MSTLWQAAADLVLGVRCEGCEAPVRGVCRSCAARFTPTAMGVTLDGVPGGLTVVAAGRHDGDLRDAVLAWKVGGRRGFDALLAHHLAVAVVALLDGDEVDLVPVPTTRRSRRERGRDLVADLARRAAGMLVGTGVDVRVRPALRLVRQPQDQHRLGPAERRRNLAGSMGVTRRPRRPVVVVDDIVTTGSTVAEAVRALACSGPVDILGAAAVAASSRGV